MLTEISAAQGNACLTRWLTERDRGSLINRISDKDIILFKKFGILGIFLDDVRADKQKNWQIK